MKYKLLSIYVDLRSAFRKAIVSCWACGTPWWSKGYFGRSTMMCIYCDKKIKIK